MDSLFNFWLACQAAKGLLLLAIIAVFWSLAMKDAIRQARCKHDGAVRETSACDAICGQCGKNLGFIGAWRKQKGGV